MFTYNATAFSPLHECFIDGIEAAISFGIIFLSVVASTFRRIASLSLNVITPLIYLYYFSHR